MRVSEDDHVRMILGDAGRDSFREVARADDVMDEKFFLRDLDGFR